MNTKMEAPVASPSRPSVRLTAFDHAVIRKFAQTMNRRIPIPMPQWARSMSVSRTIEIRSEAGVRRFGLGNWVASTANAMPTNAWPTILPSGFRPRERWREILM